MNENTGVRTFPGKWKMQIMSKRGKQIGFERVQCESECIFYIDIVRRAQKKAVYKKKMVKWKTDLVFVHYKKGMKKETKTKIYRNAENRKDTEFYDCVFGWTSQK